MTSADSTLAAELILHRPGHRAAGAARRIHIDLDDHQVADLGLGGTYHVSTTSGPHLLRARCMPLLGDSFPVVLGAGETLRVLVYVGALDRLEIHCDQQPDRSGPAT